MRDVLERLVPPLAIAFILLLQGCAPTCSGGVDGGALQGRLKDTAASERLADDIMLAVRSCQLSGVHRKFVDDAIETVGRAGSAQTQERLYMALAQAKDVAGRLVMIKASDYLTMRADKGQRTDFQWKDLDEIADLANSVAESKVDALLGAAGAGRKRVVKLVRVAAGEMLLVREITSGANWEKSELRFIREVAGKPILLPIQGGEAQGLVDYEFRCASYAGSDCSVQDTRLTFDSTSALTHVISVADTDAGGTCTRRAILYQVLDDRIAGLPSSASTGLEPCQNAPTPNDHGDPFANLQAARFTKLLLNQGRAARLVALVNLQAKDEADKALVKALATNAEGYVALKHLALGPLAAVDPEDWLDKPEPAQINAGLDRLVLAADNLKWLAESAAKTVTPVESLRSEIAKVRAQLVALESQTRVERPKENRIQTVRATVTPYVPQEIPRYFVEPFPEGANFAHFGIGLPNGTLMIVFSSGILSPGPKHYESLALMPIREEWFEQGPVKRKMLFFRTLSDAETEEYQKWRVERASYPDRLRQAQQLANVKLPEYRAAAQQVLAGLQDLASSD